MNWPTQEKGTLPTVSRVIGDMLIELVYDAEKRATALLVARHGEWSVKQTVEVPTGETLVPYSPRNNLIAHSCVLFPSTPEPYGGKETLLADVAGFLHRYVDLSPTFERIAAHYVLLTWVYDAFAEVPYLRLRGEYGTGKTRGLIAIGSLCYKPFFAAGASTVSPIFHTLDRFGGTLVMDEADFRFSDATADLVKILNNGTVKGLPVLRTVQNRYKEFNPAAFNVFGPKIIAMRGAFQDEALESRFLTEETGTRPLRADVPLYLPDALHAEALSLRNRLLDFRLRHRFATGPIPSRTDPSLDPRLNQIALPLLSLADTKDARSDIRALLRAQQNQRRHRRSQTVEAQVLRAALDTLSEAGGGDVSVQAITDQFNRTCSDTAGTLTARRIGALLKGTFHIDARRSHGVYLVPVAAKAKLTSLASHYGVDA